MENLIKASNTCSSSDTNSDQDECTKDRKRKRIKMVKKSPIRGYYRPKQASPKYSQIESHSEEVSENQLDCKMGRDACRDMIEQSSSDTDTEEGT